MKNGSLDTEQTWWLIILEYEQDTPGMEADRHLMFTFLSCLDQVESSEVDFLWLDALPVAKPHLFLSKVISRYNNNNNNNN